MKTSELTGAALDWAVCKAGGGAKDIRNFIAAHADYYMFCYSTDWSQGGPIIEREKIDLHHIGSAWTASIYAPKWHARDHEQFGPTPLIAAMRCFCCSKLGDEVDIPEELCQQQNN